MRRTPIALVTCAVLLSAAVGAQAAPPKPVSETFTFTDPTPDMTSAQDLDSTTQHCSGGTLPEEKSYAFAAPAAGTLKITLGGFQGDWALELRDTKGKILTGDDVNPPDYETATYRIKAAGSVLVHPCNLAGTVEAIVTLVYTPKK